MTKLALIAAAFVGLASTAASAIPVNDGIFHYVRANSDGSEDEQVALFRPAANRIELFKGRARCTDAAYVTVRIDPRTGQALSLSAGRLLRDAGRRETGTLRHDPATGRIDMVLTTDGKTARETLRLGAGAWHLYDLDLMTLALPRDRTGKPAASVRFALPLVQPIGGKMLHDLGKVTLTLVGEEDYEGARAIRYEASGGRPGFTGGPVWFDKADGHLVAAAWGTPNHDGYRDFTIRLRQVEAGDAVSWRALLTEHLDCVKR